VKWPKQSNTDYEAIIKTTYTQNLVAAAFVCALAFAATGAYAQVIDTHIGKIETIKGFPTAESAKKIFDESDFQRATQAYLWALPAVNFIDDGPGKPVGINSHIGRRPVAAFGNSDGDLEMLQWTAAGSGKRFCLYVHHTGAEREWAYDRESPIGKLDKGLDEAQAKGWTVVDMKNDWKHVFAWEQLLVAKGGTFALDAELQALQTPSRSDCFNNGARRAVKRYGIWKKVFCQQHTRVPDQRPSSACFLSCHVYTRCVDS
jgi:hypothetical protein